jgi:hypothetical protein
MEEDNMDAPGTAGGFDPGTAGTGHTGTEFDTVGGGGGTNVTGAPLGGGLSSADEYGEGGMDGVGGETAATTGDDQAGDDTSSSESVGTDYGGTGMSGAEGGAGSGMTEPEQQGTNPGTGAGGMGSSSDWSQGGGAGTEEQVR